MEKIRFISESVQVNDIPLGPGRLFTFFNDETHLSQLLSKLDMSIEEDFEIPVGVSSFKNKDLDITIMNTIGAGVISGFTESKH